MKRDMDLIRALLHLIEERPEGASGKTIGIEGKSPGEIRLHLELMRDAGFIDELSFTSSGAYCQRLTFEGYEFLESTRKETVWNKAKEVAVKETGGLSLVALSEAVKLAIKAAIAGSF